MNIWKFSVYIQFFFIFRIIIFFFLVLFENVRYFRYSCTEIRDDKKKTQTKLTSIEDKV